MLMAVFLLLVSIVDQGQKDGKLINDYFRYTSTVQFPDSSHFFDLPAYDSQSQRLYISSLKHGCNSMNINNYYYSKIAVLSVNQSLGQEFQTYFQNYVVVQQDLKQNKTDKYFQIDYYQDQEFLENIIKNQNNQPYCFYINLKNFDVINDVYDIQFSYDQNSLPNTNLPSFTPQINQPDTLNWNRWQDSGALALFPFLTEFIARYKVSAKNANFQNLFQSQPLYTQQMGYSPMRTDFFKDITTTGIQLLQKNFPFFIMIIYKIPFFYVTSKIAYEKESKVKEGMKMMGLKDFTYYFSWILTYLFISGITSLIVTTMLCVVIFQNLNYLLVFTFFQLYAMTNFGISFIIIAFLPTKRSSSISAILFNFVTFFLFEILNDPSTSDTIQNLLSVFPNVCMNQICKQIFFLSYQTKDGLTFESSGIVYQGYSFRIGLLFILAEAILFIGVGLYLDSVVKHKFGISKPWNFMCLKRKIVCKKILNIDKENYMQQKSFDIQNPNFEQVSDQLKNQELNFECLQILNLVKTFDNKIAIDGINLSLFKSQIFALLGHNGAGKTTTLSILTGLLEPTQGEANYFGKNIFEGMSEFRQNLGVCPQHDVLFENLTVEDHLRLFSSFKGADADQIESQVQQMITDIDLEQVKTQLSSTLSGGQKRKLTVAIAMIGSSKVVMLDEPSSGMDAAARRNLWKMLKKNKNGKIIILTTHYMDEADVLADRIGIMSEGKIKCIGSSLFLKNKFGIGYKLKLEKYNDCNSQEVDNFINQNIKGSKKVQEVQNQIIYQLPKNSSPTFKKFFNEFDQNLQILGIRSYGVGVTTLEEVFLNISKQISQEEKQIENNDYENLQNQQNLKDQEVRDYSFQIENENKNQFLEQLWVLMKKKFKIQIRDRQSLVIDILFPIILIIVGIRLSTLQLKHDQVEKLMDSSLIPFSPNIFINNQSSIINDPVQVLNFVQNFFIPLKYKNNQIQKKYEIVPILVNCGIIQQISQLDDYVFSSSKNGKQSNEEIFVIQADPVNGYVAALILNSASQDIAGVYAAVSHTAFLKKYLFDSQIEFRQNLTVNLIDKPFPITQQTLFKELSISGTSSALFLSISWLMLSDSLIQNIIREREMRIKHLIILSGTSLNAYWLSHYLCDIIFQAVPSLFAIIGIQVFNVQADQVYYLFIIMIFANPAFIYFLSFFFEKEETGSLIVKIIYFLIGIIVPIVLLVLQIFMQKYAYLAQFVRWFFFPFPIFSLIFGFISICNIDIIRIFNQLQYRPCSFDILISGPNLYFLIGSIFVYWIFVIIFELKLIENIVFKNTKIFLKYFLNIVFKISQVNQNKQQISEQKEDYDITNESDRVNNLQTDTPVKVFKIKKSFGEFSAVQDISFGLEYGECFALLGISGSGKTTCFKCLTGELFPSNGSMSIFGHDITSVQGFEKARKMIGYCPQFDAIFEGLTVKEHLFIYATLKGVKSDKKDQIVQNLILDMNLDRYTDIKANQLSGGNKRKLSVAIAILGNPPIILLDEPSTGVDPQAKRFMWNLVSQISTLQKKSCVIITTHSMDEAEALCTKMGIMVEGNFKCFGTTTHIMDKYGTGFEIEYKIRPLSQDKIENIFQLSKIHFKSFQKSKNNQLVDNKVNLNISQLHQDQHFEEQKQIQLNFEISQGEKVNEHIIQNFKEFKILENFGSSWKIRVSRDNLSIGNVFGIMEDIKEKFNISEYSVTQTSLDQIFNDFAQKSKKQLINSSILNSQNKLLTTLEIDKIQDLEIPKLFQQ